MRHKVFFLLQQQRGAMFGLDARLAMIVFAAMAVVAGFYGYSRVETAREARLIRELEAVAAAIQDFQLDMRLFYPFALADSDGDTDLAALWDASLVKPTYQARWNGPYLLDEGLRHKHFGRWWLRYGQNDFEMGSCTLQSECYVWLYLSEVPMAMWEQTNYILDESSGKNPEPDGLGIEHGRVRATSEDDPRTLIFRTAKRRR